MCTMCDLIFIISFLCFHQTYGLDLSVYQTASYTNPIKLSEFTHFTTHSKTGTVYVGASDALYQLGEDFVGEKTNITTVAQCEDQSKITCPNYNKVLLIDYAHNRLITCGSENQGTCQTRDLSNINNVLQEDDSSVVASGKLSTEAIIAPGPENGGVGTLYVGATYEEERYGKNKILPVSRRTLNVTNYLFNIEMEASIQLNLDSFAHVQFIINYVNVFQWNEFTYFVTSQRKDADETGLNLYVSKINRICHSAEDLSNYAEILLECSASNINYNLIQAAYVGPAGQALADSLVISAGDDVLYGVFAKNEGEPLSSDIPSNQSALCVYKLQDIQEAFIDAIYGCLTQGGQFSSVYIPGSLCNTYNATRDFAVKQQCNAINWAIADGIDPLVSTAAIEWSGILPSSIITTTNRNHTVAFVGTAGGDLVKVHIESITSAREYERVSLGSPVLKDAKVDNTKETVTLLTQKKLMKLQVENCTAYKTCEDCIGVNGGDDGDPYCGWCTLERKCTRYDACPMPDVSNRWLPYNSVQCVDISNVANTDSLPITLGQQQITLTVEQLPDLIDGHSYQCIFDDTTPSPASKSGNELTCITPAGSDIPRIQSGNDHIIMQLYVFSTETQVKFVQRDFFFYECKTHKMCVACTNSSWACDWCIYSNECTHDNSICSNDDSTSIISGVNNPDISTRHGQTECPQLAVQGGEILVSDGVSTQISVTGVNLPDEKKVNSYKCILDIEGKKAETEATRNGNVFTCTARIYNYDANVQHINIRLSVIWNNDRILDDVYGFTVTLYKCAVDRPDCSRCLSNLATRPELNCGWCSMDGKCTVQDSSHCSGGWMPSTTNNNCPNPTLMEVFPPSGPLSGNTIITISGSNLGKQLTDIASIKVGVKDCNMTGLEEKYVAGNSVSCRTMSGFKNIMEPITVTVTGANGNPQQSTGEIVFTYRDPLISSFDPIEGPAAGGTIVTITGQYLDACREISATIGSECVMNRMDDVLNSTTARCRTTSSSVESSHKLSILFDEITEKESLEEFTYRTNPTVGDVQPKKTIQSGGITLTVTGTGFRLAQLPQIILYIDEEQFTEDCQIHNDTMMLCRTPNTKSTTARRKRAAVGETSFGFIIGDVIAVLRWSDDNNVTMEYFEDPIYYQFETNPVPKSGGVELIMGSNLDSGSSEIDVTVYIGTKEAITKSLSETILTIELPKNNPGQNCINGNTTSDPCVVVFHGNLKFNIGTIKYPSTSPGAIIGITLACVTLSLMVVLVVVLVLIRYKVKGQKEDLDKLAVEMREMESDIADDIKAAFVQLQTDVTDLTSDLKGTGMPFVSHRQYAISMFFAGLDIQPMTYDPEGIQENAEKAMLEFSKLLSNKEFLIAFIQILDEDKSIPNKDKLTIGSLLTVLMILEDKLSYLTDVMFALMTEQIQEAVEENKPNKVFQRTESITEKLLSNWIALSLYDFLKQDAAHPLFLLYHAIKCQSEKGPIDAVSGKSYKSLNDENIISQPIKYETLTLNVVINDEDGESKEVKVLDVDTISQVKGKVLDSIHRSRAYSCRMQPSKVDLVWRHGKSGHLVLQDVDVSSETEEGWKRVNTLKHFSVPDGSVVALALKQDVPNVTVPGGAATRHSNVGLNPEHDGLSKRTDGYQVEEGVQIWHLVKQKEEDPYMTFTKKKKKKSYKRTIRLKKHVHEISFSRILGTKGTVQEYMDGMFAAILNTQNVPVGIKYIFDFFDQLAVTNSIEDDTVLHKWKSNILPLRFWQKIISNPQYIFDICQSQCVEASLSVISQAFYDAFRRNPTKISKDTSYRKLLYNHEIPQYRKMVENYYSSVSQMPQINKSTLEDDLNKTCQKFTSLFSRLSTLLELQKLMMQYKNKLMDALEENEDDQETSFAEKLGEVVGMLERDNDLDEPRYSYSQDARTVTENEYAEL